MSTVAGSQSTRNKRVMDALMLAITGSAITKVVNAGTLQYFIEFTLRDMLTGATFDLAPLYNVLAAEPGLTPEAIFPPLLAVKEWEDKLGVSVKLPPPLAALGRAEVEEHLARLSVRPTELERIASPGAPTAACAVVPDAASGEAGPAAPQSPPVRSAGTAQRVMVARKPARSRRRDTASRGGFLEAHGRAILAVATVVTVVMLGYAVHRAFGEPGSSYAVGRYAGIVRLERARRVRYSVEAVIADPGWQSRPAAQRRASVEKLFQAMKADGVQTLLLRDASGRSRALISTVGGRLTFQLD